MAYALAARLERAVKNAGVKYKKVSGWASRGHGTMGSIQSIICHHTAGPASGNAPSLNVVAYGRPGLSGPLSQLFLARDGTVYLVAAGVSYHAGRVVSNKYTNSHAIGIEAEATGTSSWPAHQVNEYAKLCKALIKEFGLSTSRVVGHKEAAPRRKIDPNFSMNDFRAKVGGAKGGVSSGGGTSGGSGGKYESPKAKHAVGSRVMGLYDGGTDVKWLQKRLYKLGWDNSMDGMFGPHTQKLVKALQRDSKLAQDGLAGPKTIAAAKAAEVVRNLPSKPKHAKPKSDSFPLPKGHFYYTEDRRNTVHSGYWSKDRPAIRKIQAKVGTGVDGGYGGKTKAAVMRWQRKHGLKADGAVGANTWAKMF